MPDLPGDFVSLHAIELNRYWRKAIGEGTLYPNTVEVIRELFIRGYRLGIISNTVSSEETPNLIKKYNIENFFETVVLSCNFGMRKPSPSIFHAATDYMRVDPKNCAYVGDQIDRDIIGSKDAGFSTSILIEHTPDTKKYQGESNHIPDYQISSLLELLDIFPIRYNQSANSNNIFKDYQAKKYWNVSLSTMWSFENHLTLPEILPVLDQLELSGIELNHNIISSDLMGVDLGKIPVRSLHEPCPADVSMSALSKTDWQISAVDEQNRRQGVRMIMRSIDLAFQLGVKHIVVHPGNAGLSDHDEKKLRKLFENGKIQTQEYLDVKQKMIENRNEVINERFDSVKRSIKELLEYVNSKNIRLALENRYHFMDIPSPVEMGKLLELAGSDRLGMQFDIGHAQTLDQLGFYPFMEWIENHAKRIIGLHIHDVKGVDDHYAPGLGEVNYELFSRFIPTDAQRTLEVRGMNSIEAIKSGLLLLDQVGLIQRF